MPTESDSAGTPSFEQSLAELEKIVQQLEDGEVGLADALQSYERGVALLRSCYQLLERAERKIELLTGVDAQGHPVTKPFEDSSPTDLEQKALSRGSRRAPRGKKPLDVEDSDNSGGLF